MRLVKKPRRIAFRRIEQIAEYNGAKVLKAFSDNRVSEPCFYGSTGYGYGDIGREVIDKVFAQALGTEDALVRFNFVSGTHALSVALFGVLRTGDKIVSITGKPYDTLEEVIGISGEKGNGSLMDYGVEYGQVDLNSDGSPKLDEITEAVKDAKVAYIQRSRGYSLRGAFTVDDIGKMNRPLSEQMLLSVLLSRMPEEESQEQADISPEEPILSSFVHIVLPASEWERKLAVLSE